MKPKWRLLPPLDAPRFWVLVTGDEGRTRVNVLEQDGGFVTDAVISYPCQGILAFARIGPSHPHATLEAAQADGLWMLECLKAWTSSGAEMPPRPCLDQREDSA